MELLVIVVSFVVVSAFSYQLGKLAASVELLEKIKKKSGDD